MAISAAVIGDGGAMSTAGALIDMAAEYGGATAGNGQQHFDVRPADPLAVALDESCSGRAYQVGHFQARPTHFFLGCDWPLSFILRKWVIGYLAMT
jgi:hypothetical protein